MNLMGHVTVAGFRTGHVRAVCCEVDRLDDDGVVIACTSKGGVSCDIPLWLDTVFR